MYFKIRSFFQGSNLSAMFIQCSAITASHKIAAYCARTSAEVPVYSLLWQVHIIKGPSNEWFRCSKKQWQSFHQCCGIWETLSLQNNCPLSKDLVTMVSFYIFMKGSHLWQVHIFKTSFLRLIQLFEGALAELFACLGTRGTLLT